MSNRILQGAHAPDLTSRSHCAHSGSIANRWMKCPASSRMTRGIAAKESPYAAEGTRAHEEAQRCLELRLNSENPKIQMHVDHCRRLIDLSEGRYWIKPLIILAAFNPPVGWGSPDAVIYISRYRELHIIEFKFGRGV